MNEFEWLQRLKPLLPITEAVVEGAGDDCAVLDLGIPGRWTLLKTDAVVETIHFEPQAPPEKIGHKALGRCLSDIAAMGGEPVAALITVGLPEGSETDRILAIYRGMAALAGRYRVALVGGETTRTTGPFWLSISVLGSVAPDRCARRSGARTGDALFVTGELGGSAQGKHLDFEPRLAEGRWLVEHFKVHAMIDLSDGLATDLRHVLQSSGVGCELLASAIPISPAARRGLKGKSSALDAALTDGEDFELLFAVSGKDAVRLLDGWRARFPGVRLSCIGKISDTPGLRIRRRGKLESVEGHGYDHFTKS